MIKKSSFFSCFLILYTISLNYAMHGAELKPKNIKMKNLKQYENWAKTGRINDIKISNIFSVYEILGIKPNEIIKYESSKKSNK